MAINRDGSSGVEVIESLRPAVHTATNGQEVDLRGADSVLIACTTGAITGSANAATLIKIQDTDTAGSGHADVSAANVIGTMPTTLTANTIYQFAYKGGKRYLRIVIANGGATNVAASGVVIKGGLHREPAGYSVAT